MGYQGFVKVGEREESEEVKMAGKLRDMGYHPDVAALAGVCVRERESVCMCM